MKIIRFVDEAGNIQHGNQKPDGSTTILEGDILGEYHDTGIPSAVSKLLAPIVPVDILCIGQNYARHAAEGGSPVPKNPVLFMKNIGSLQNPGDPIILPKKFNSVATDYECELGVVLGKECLNVSAERALEHVLGYICVNDVSERDWQLKPDLSGTQWCRAKTFNTFAPMGPCLVTTDEIPDPNTLGIKTILNGTVMQDWNTDDMIFNVPTLIEFLSSGTRLLPGTVISTGTPHGVGFARNPPVFLQNGDTVTIEIEKIGALTNPVVNEVL